MQFKTYDIFLFKSNVFVNNQYFFFVVNTQFEKSQQMQFS